MLHFHHPDWILNRSEWRIGHWQTFFFGFRYLYNKREKDVFFLLQMRYQFFRQFIEQVFDFDGLRIMMPMYPRHFFGILDKEWDVFRHIGMVLPR